MNNVYGTCFFISRQPLFTQKNEKKAKMPVLSAFPPLIKSPCATAQKTCARGFEPPTFWSVAKRSIQLS